MSAAIPIAVAGALTLSQAMLLKAEVNQKGGTGRQLLLAANNTGNGNGNGNTGNGNGNGNSGNNNGNGNVGNNNGNGNTGNGRGNNNVGDGFGNGSGAYATNLSSRFSGPSLNWGPWRHHFLWRR